MKNTADVTGGKPIAVLLQSIGVSSINPLVAFYDIRGGKREMLLFCPGHHTKRVEFVNGLSPRSRLSVIYEAEIPRKSFFEGL
jgi:hypothetical protein